MVDPLSAGLAGLGAVGAYNLTKAIKGRKRSLSSIGPYDLAGLNPKMRKLYQQALLIGGGGGGSTASSVGPSMRTATSTRVRHGHSAVMTTTKKRKRKGKSVPQFSAKEKKSIKRIAANDDWKLRYDYVDLTGAQMSAPVNYVQWGALSGEGKTADIIDSHDIAMVMRGLSASAISTTVDADMSTVAGLTGINFGMKIEREYKFYFKNNSNFQCELVLYNFKAAEDTSNTPLVDIDNRLKNRYNTITNTLNNVTDKESNPFQYFSVEKGGASDWKIKNKVVFHLLPGQEAKPFFQQKFRVHVPKSDNQLDFQKGHEVLYYRIMGVPSHDDTTDTLTGLANAKLDYITTARTKLYLRGGGLVGETDIPDTTRSGFGLTVPVQASLNNANVEAIEH